MDGAAHHPLDRRYHLALALLVAGLLAATAIATARSGTDDGGSGDALPTETEARALLARTYDRARTEPDPQRFCEPNAYPLTCVNHYREAGGSAAVPTSPPTVVGVRAMGAVRVLTVCGVDGLGRPFRADFPVQRSDGRLQGILDVFWDDTNYHGRQRDGAPVVATPDTSPRSC